MADHMTSVHTILLSALSTLPSPHLRRLTLAISTLSRRHLGRLTALLSSPLLFYLTLRRLRSLSVHHKSFLIAQYLFSNLAILKPYFAQNDAVAPPIAPPCLDAALLLLLLCEIHQHDRKLLDAPISRWRVVLSNYVSNSILRVSNLAGCWSGGVLVEYVGSVARCWNLVVVIGGGGKEVPAAAAAVVALPAVAASGGRECAICTEEMREGFRVCELPCGHLFHWTCVLRWLRKRHTCPCCRRRLPTDDIRHEIGQLVNDLARIGGGGRLYGECWFN